MTSRRKSNREPDSALSTLATYFSNPRVLFAFVFVATFLSYVLFEIPSNVILARVGARAHGPSLRALCDGRVTGQPTRCSRSWSSTGAATTGIIPVRGTSAAAGAGTNLGLRPGRPR